MTEQQSSARIVLGPAASKLIEGVSGSRQAALDKAILGLQSRVSEKSSAGAEPGVDLSPIEKRLAAIEIRMEESIKVMDRLRLIALSEMRATRLYIGTMMEARDEEDIRAILEIGEQTQQRLYEELEVLTQDDVAQFTRDEERILQMVREEFNRTGPQEPGREKDDLERV